MKDIDNVQRTRRSLAKAAALVFGVAAGMAVTGKKASAHGPHHGGGGSCFLTGTLIATPLGDRRIEELKAGDTVRTEFGGVCRITAIASHRYSREGIAAPWDDKAKPVRIMRSAIADNVPSQDLYLTRDHAVFVDGVLVPAINLVNGTTIVIDDAEDAEILEYFHIELDHHDVIEANGAKCETLIDAANREFGSCAPVLTYNGGRDQLKSRLRSAASVWIDRRTHLDQIRDEIEERGLLLGNIAVVSKSRGPAHARI
ncbi:MAG: Hint domain-containing protein [Pseudomonadota bacterium]